MVKPTRNQLELSAHFVRWTALPQPKALWDQLLNITAHAFAGGVVFASLDKLSIWNLGNQMRFATAIILLALQSTAQATVVTFEELTVLEEDVGSVSSAGYTFTGADLLIVQNNASSDGNHVWAGNAPGGTTTLTITRDDGQLFDLHSFDLEGVGGDFTIEGYDAFDQLIASTEYFPSGWDTIVFDAAWSNVSSIVIEDSIFSFGPLMPTTAGVRLDNFSATVVPLPAAAWLFGSALAGLGWMRRRQTA